MMEARIVHPGFKLVMFLLLGMLPFIFQDPRVLAVVYLVILLLVTRIGWTATIFKTYLFLGIIGGIFTAFTWLPFMTIGRAYWETRIPLIGLPVKITDMGVVWAIGMGLRIANVALLSIVYLFSTPPREIAIGLKGIGVPYSVGFLISLVFRMIPLVKNDLGTIREAQRVRGLDLDKGSFAGKVKKFSSILVPLIFSSLKRVQLIANALDAKGFKMRNRRHRFYKTPKWRAVEIGGVLVGVAIMMVLFYFARIHPQHFGVLVPSRI